MRSLRLPAVLCIALALGACGGSGSPGSSAPTAAPSSSPTVTPASAVVAPCDLYRTGGTPCVAAHSTTRALFGAYAGPLYLVQRASDGTTLQIGTLQAGGYANSAAQNSFCRATTCTITTIYDQTGNGNHLYVSPAGPAGAADTGAQANALPVFVAGNPVYGILVNPGIGYRNTHAVDTPTGGDPEGVYMVTTTAHVNGNCCFDYGNTEQPVIHDAGPGTMDALNVVTGCSAAAPCGSAPDVNADLEDGLFPRKFGSYTRNQVPVEPFVTATLQNTGQTTFRLMAGNAQGGTLAVLYDGTLPTSGGYVPLQQQGGITLGVGGDNSNAAEGEFFEGAMTASYPSNATEAAVAANVVAARYATSATSAEANGDERSGVR